MSWAVWVFASLVLVSACDRGERADAISVDATPPASSQPVLADPAPPRQVPSSDVQEDAALRKPIDDAVSGDRTRMIAAKDALKRKKNSGTATEQEAKMLRALCRQLGDMSCAY